MKIIINKIRNIMLIFLMMRFLLIVSGTGFMAYNVLNWTHNYQYVQGEWQHNGIPEFSETHPRKQEFISYYIYNYSTMTWFTVGAILFTMGIASKMFKDLLTKQGKGISES